MLGTRVAARVHVTFELFISLGHMCCNNNNFNYGLVGLSHMFLCWIMIWLSYDRRLNSKDSLSLIFMIIVASAYSVAMVFFVLK